LCATFIEEASPPFGKPCFFIVCVLRRFIHICAPHPLGNAFMTMNSCGRRKEGRKSVAGGSAGCVGQWEFGNGHNFDDVGFGYFYLYSFMFILGNQSSMSIYWWECTYTLWVLAGK
jgi:hypothetical protein